MSRKQLEGNLPTQASNSHAGGREHGYPRPQLWRAGWISLNGTWSFAIDFEARWRDPSEVAWAREIEVPFAPEAARSGVGEADLFRACWYRRTVDVPDGRPGERLILHFGAVDYETTVWIKGNRAAHHVGGYTPFAIDITDLVGQAPAFEIAVRAEDDPADLAKPRGKQDWQLDPHSIWYPRTTGIWQTVWMERVPATSIAALRWASSLERWELDFYARVTGEHRDDLRLRLRLHANGSRLAEDEYAVIAGEVHRCIALSDPGLDDSRNHLLWSPESPTLIRAEVELVGRDGEVVDQVGSYTALRSIAIQGSRIVLNGRPLTLRLVLDQGYWPDSGMTAPNDQALRRDVELTRAMGFNGVRKHQKIEDPRYLYWADRLGLLVWEEMPSAYRFTSRSVERLTREWTDVIGRDFSHPCIMAWVPFNESWGVPNLPESDRERHAVSALYHLTKTLDPSRPVIGNDGWESVATDIIGIHDYDAEPARLAQRYHGGEVRLGLLREERPGGRLIMLDGHEHKVNHPVVLSEFGGIALRREGVWGYTCADDPYELGRAYERLLSVVRSASVLCGFCYTQFADTYQEANGLLTADRQPKFPLEQIAAATRGHVAHGLRHAMELREREGPRQEGLIAPSAAEAE